MKYRLLTGVLVSAFILLVGSTAHAQITDTYQIWNPAGVNGTFGSDPNQTDADPAGVTMQVDTPTNPLTNVTVYENTGCSGRPCGLVYWNPRSHTEVPAPPFNFKCLGYSSGFMSGVDVNTSAPTLMAGATTFQAGDTWLAKTSFVAAGGGFPAPPADPCGGRCSLSVNFKGSNSFRSWEVGRGAGVQVDQGSGLVWHTSTGPGVIGRLDPTTNVDQRWAVGGTPNYSAVDSAGDAFSTVASNRIVRVSPTGLGAAPATITVWTIPAALSPSFFGSSPAAFFGNPNGITIDADGKVWVSFTSGNAVARLDPTTNQICRFTKTGIGQPQNIASSGTTGAGDKQAFFTEASGNAVGLLTEVEADLMGAPNRICATVTPTTPAIPTVVLTLPFADHTRAPTTAFVTPTSHTVPALDGVPASPTAPVTTGTPPIPIPPLLRFPLPSPASTPPHFPALVKATGMTEVALAGTVFGSIIGPFAGGGAATDRHFELQSGAIIAPPAAPADPLSLKNSAVSELQAIKAAIQATPTPSGVGSVADAVKDIDEAIAFIQASIANIDSTNPLNILSVNFFLDEEDAVEEVFDTVDSGEITNASILSDLKAVIDKLHDAEELIVNNAIANFPTGGDPDDLADANAELATALAQVAACTLPPFSDPFLPGPCDDAVGSFEDAWLNATGGAGTGHHSSSWEVVDGGSPPTELCDTPEA